MVVRTMQVLSLPSVGVDENFFSLEIFAPGGATRRTPLARNGRACRYAPHLTHPTAEQLARALEHNALDQTRAQAATAAPAWIGTERRRR